MVIAFLGTFSIPKNEGAASILVMWFKVIILVPEFR
jgi:hypothetical protein